LVANFLFQREMRKNPRIFCIHGKLGDEISLVEREILKELERVSILFETDQEKNHTIQQHLTIMSLEVEEDKITAHLSDSRSCGIHWEELDEDISIKIFLNGLKVKAGQTFKDCLTTHNDTTSYNNLLNFSFNNTNAGIINLDCDFIVSRPTFSTTTTGSSTSTPNNSSIPTADPSVNYYPNNSDLPKILPPVIGGSLIITTAVGYCCYKKRKKKILLIAGSSEEKIPETTIQQSEKVTQEVINDENLNKREALIRLIRQIKNKIGIDLEITLETLLDTQSEITQGNNTFAIRQLQREAKEKLRKKITAEEINKLCQLQAEVTQLEMENTDQIQAQIEIAPQQQILANPQ
ncbi:12552_t:CDS:2, partial [Racocetra persica]